MKNKLLLFLFLIASVAWGQTTEILNNTLRTQDEIDLWNPIEVTHETGGQGYARFRDLNSSLTTPEFNASVYNSIEVQMSVAKFGNGADGPITVLYSLDGGDTWLTGGNSLTPDSSDYSNSSITIEATSSTMVIRFTRTNSPSEKRLRDVIISGIGTGISCQDSNLVFPTATETADLVDGTFTQTATSLNATTAITYTSSDEDVATVNPTTGEVTLVSVGTTTITATQAAGEHNGETYCGATITYTLNVIDTTPSLTVSTNSLSFTGYEGGSFTTQDLAITGLNLTGDITLTLTGDTNFTINPTTLSATGGDVTITYTPSATPASHSATLTVTNGSLSEVIALSGVTNEMPAIGCFEENFDGITNGNSTSSTGSNSQWNGNDNFPTVDRAYQAGGAVRLGTGSVNGSITSVPLTDYVGQNVTVSFSSKAWGTNASSILISFGTQSQVVDLPAASSWTDGLSDYEVVFENIEPNATLTFESNSTSERRFFIDNVAVCLDVPSTDPVLSASETEITGLGYMEGNASVSQSFSLSGMNLEPASGNITVTAPAYFQVSTDDVSFNNSLNIAYTDGALAATDVYVRLNESLAINTYNGNITISGGGASDAIVSVEGIVTAFSEDCGFENFDNAELTTSYEDGSFVGNNGITWTYGHSRNEGDYAIDGKGLMLRRASDSYLEAIISGGIGTFSFDYRKAFTGENVRQLELLVDGVQVATTDEFGGFSGEDDTIYNLSYDINTTETVTIKIKNVGSTTSNRQTVIDNISWTCYSEAPTITWNGSVSSAWDVAENWTPNAVPTYEDNVEIAEVETNNYPIIEVDAEANNIKVNANASLVIAASHSLTITNEINVDDNASFVVRDGANLVQINDVANIGSISVEKGFTFSEERNQYNFVISPVVGQNIKELFGVGANYKAQWYNEETNYFVFFDGDYLGAGIGQAIQENQLGASEQVAIYKGVPHNGEYTVEGLGNENTGFHLAGNPYPSHLDLVKFYNDNQNNIEPRFLFWDNRGNEDIIQYGDGYHGDHYAQINLDHGTATAASGATGDLRVPTQNVAVGNAFMLRLLETTESASYSFNNSQRTAGQGQNFLGRNYSTDGIVSSEMDRYWLTLNTPGGISVMNAVVYYDGGNDDFGLDDNKIMGGSDDIYTLVDEHQLKIQGKSSFDVNDKIKLGYKAYAAGIHTISIYDKEGVFADGQKIFIRDFQTGIVHELTQSDFTFKTFAGEFNDRFEIFYKRSIKASENKATLSNVVIYQNENHIQIAAENQLLSDVEIYDLNGVSVYQATDINLENWQVPNHLFGKGILVVVVKTADGEVVNKKLINK